MPKEENNALMLPTEQETALLQISGQDYDDIMEEQNEEIVPSLPQVKSLKEYKNFVYEIGVDEDGNPERLELTEMKGIIFFWHSMRALFYKEKDHGHIWQLFPQHNKTQILERYSDSNIPLCSSFDNMPNREFKFAAKCQSCPLNAFGSPCKPKERLFMKINAKDKNGKSLIDFVSMTLPVTSLKWWSGKNGYLATLRQRRSKNLPKGIPVSAIWTTFTRKWVKSEFEYYEIHMNHGDPLQPITAEEAAEVKEFRQFIKDTFMKMTEVDYAGPSGLPADDDAPY